MRKHYEEKFKESYIISRDKSKKRIIEHLKDNKGDAYIQMLICTTILLLMSVIFFSVSTSITDKLKIDQAMDDIASVVASTGTTSSAVLTELENELISAYGGYVTYETTYYGNESLKRVQLNNMIIITYHSDKYTAFLISDYEISTPINIQRTAISEVLWK